MSEGHKIKILLGVGHDFLLMCWTLPGIMQETTKAIHRL